MKKPVSTRSALIIILSGIAVMAPLQALAQLPARYYLDTLSGAKAVPLVYQSISGNTNPFDPSNAVNAGADIDAELAMVGYATIFPLFDRSAMAAIIIPNGRISGDVTVAGNAYSQSASGFGDPMLEFNINVVGPAAQKNIPDVLRYEPGISVDLLVDVALPIGEYDESQPLNIGQNRWYGRFGAPVMLQLGEWVPGRRSTLELLPAVWMFGDNDDYVGLTMETDPLYQLDVHLTQDFTENLWGSIDFVSYSGGQATIGGVKGDKLNNSGLGYTLGYTISDNLNLTVGYKSTINDDKPDDLSMDAFMVTLVFGWHPLLEGSRRLQQAN